MPLLVLKVYFGFASIGHGPIEAKKGRNFSELVAVIKKKKKPKKTKNKSEIDKEPQKYSISIYSIGQYLSMHTEIFEIRSNVFLLIIKFVL